MTRMDKEEIKEILCRGFAALEIDIDEVYSMVDKIREAKTVEEADEIYNKFKADIKRRYHKKALECHPDHGGNEEEFKEFSQIMKALDHLKIHTSTHHRIRRRQYIKFVIMTRKG